MLIVIWIIYFVSNYYSYSGASDVFVVWHQRSLIEWESSVSKYTTPLFSIADEGNIRVFKKFLT